MGVHRSSDCCRACSLSAMRLLTHRISPDDAKISYAGAGWSALRSQGYSERILLRRLSLHLDKPGRTEHRPPLASFLPRSGFAGKLAPGEPIACPDNRRG